MTSAFYMCGLSMRNVQTLSAWCMVLHTDSAYLWVLVCSSHLNSNRAMLAYVASGPSGSHSTLVCGTVAPGDQRSGVWHAVAHGCFPVQRQSGISSCVKQAHATLNFNADTKTTEIWFTPSWCAVGPPHQWQQSESQTRLLMMCR